DFTVSCWFQFPCALGNQWQRPDDAGSVGRHGWWCIFNVEYFDGRDRVDSWTDCRRWPTEPDLPWVDQPAVDVQKTLGKRRVVLHQAVRSVPPAIKASWASTAWAAIAVAGSSGFRKRKRMHDSAPLDRFGDGVDDVGIATAADCRS